MGLILSCSENYDSIESSEILDTQFTYHQDLGMLYFSMTVDTDYLSSSNVEASVLWNGTNISNSPDSLLLNEPPRVPLLLEDGILSIHSLALPA